MKGVVVVEEGGATQVMVVEDKTTAVFEVNVTVSGDVIDANLQTVSLDSAPAKPEPDMVSTVPPVAGVEIGVTERTVGVPEYVKVTPESSKVTPLFVTVTGTVPLSICLGASQTI